MNPITTVNKSNMHLAVQEGLRTMDLPLLCEAASWIFDFRNSEDPYKLILLLQMLADREPDILCYLGECYEKGIGLRQDQDLALVCFKEAGAQGCPRAEYHLAWDYMNKKEYLRALECFQHCISADNSEETLVAAAYRGIGFCHAESPDHDMRKAVENWKIAVDKYHDEIAARELGKWYADTNSDHYDSAKCLHYLTIAVDGEDEESVSKLASLYLFGSKELGISRDVIKAESLLLPYSDGNDLDILCALGILYLLGGDGVSPDLPKARVFLERRFELLPSPSVADLLGECCFRMGDYAAAVPMLELAAENNIFNHSHFLGRIYKNGFNGQVDKQKASHYYKASFDTGPVDGGHFNGYFCEEYIELLEDLHQYEQAFTVAKKALEVYEHVSFLRAQAEYVLLHGCSGMTKDCAIDLCHNMIDRDIGATEANRLLGEYYYKTGIYSDAVRYFHAAVNGGDVGAEAMLQMAQKKLNSSAESVITISDKKVYNTEVFDVPEDHISLNVLGTRILVRAKETNLPLEKAPGKLRRSVFDSGKDCLILYHPKHKNSYFKKIIYFSPDGPQHTLSIGVTGTSKMGTKLSKLELAKNGAKQTFQGGNTSFQTAFAIGSAIGGALGSIGASQRKMQEESNWYETLNVLLAELLFN